MYKWRFLWLIPALAPLVFNADYLFWVWRSTPPDHWDWVFFLSAILAAAAGWRRIAAWAGKPSRYGWIVLGLGAALFGFGQLFHIFTVQIAGGIIFLAGMVYTTGGQRLFCGTLPLFMVALLGCPSTTYWSEFFWQLALGSGMVDGLAFKLLTALPLLGWFLWNCLRGPVVLLKLMFPALLLLIAMALLIRHDRAEYGIPMRPDAERLNYGSYLGRREAATAQENRFFAGCELYRITYFGERDTISFLGVELGGVVHKIHPAALCMKSAGQQVLRFREKRVPVRGGEVAVQEVLADYPGGGRYLIYVWYVGPEWSTGNFLAFRRSWKPGTDWFSFQLMTAVHSTPEEAVRRLDAFLDILSAEPASVAAPPLEKQ